MSEQLNFILTPEQSDLLAQCLSQLLQYHEGEIRIVAHKGRLQHIHLSRSLRFGSQDLARQQSQPSPQ